MSATPHVSNVTPLIEAFRLAMEEVPPPQSKKAIVERIVERVPAAFEAWARGQLLAFVARLWPKQEDPRQMFFEGFRDLRARLPLDQGTVELGKATLSELRIALKIIKAAPNRSRDKKLERVQALINNIEPYARTNPGITYEECCDRAAAGERPRTPARPHKPKEELRRIARERMAKLTAEQRKAIARKREATKAARKHRKRFD